MSTNIAPTMKKIQSYSNPLVIDLALRNHIMHLWHEASCSIIVTSFPGNTAPSNWSDAVSKARVLKTHCENFALNYAKFMSTQPGQIKKDLEGIEKTIEECRNTLMGGGASDTIEPKLKSVEQKLMSSHFDLLTTYQGFETDWSGCVAKVNDLITTIPAIPSRFTELLEQYKSAMQALGVQINQAYQNRDWFSNPWNLVECVVSPNSTFLKGFIAVFIKGDLALENLSQQVNTMQEVCDKLAGLEPDEKHILTANGKLKAGMFLADRVSEMNPGYSSLSMLHAEREQLLQSVKNALQTELKELDIIILDKALSDVQEFLTDVQYAVMPMTYNNAVLQVGLTPAEVQAKLETGQTETLVQHWKNIMTSVPDPNNY